MKTFKQIVADASETITETMPWDVEERIKDNKDLMIVDIREECEFSRFHIKGSMLVPRGILESACEDEYEDAIPDLVNGRDKEIILSYDEAKMCNEKKNNEHRTISDKMLLFSLALLAFAFIRHKMNKEENPMSKSSNYT